MKFNFGNESPNTEEVNYVYTNSFDTPNEHNEEVNYDYSDSFDSPNEEVNLDYSDGFDNSNMIPQFNAYTLMKELYKSGKIKKLTKEERELLEFCHNTDMRKFLAEEFQRNPINSADAQDGILGTIY